MGTKRMIYVPGYERWVTVGQYVQAVKMAKANPDATFKKTLTDWLPGTGRQIMQEFMRGVMDRINQGVPYSKRGIAA